MRAEDPIRLYLDPDQRRQVQTGRHNFLGHVIGALDDRGHRIEIRDDDDAGLLASAATPGRALFHMHPPTTPQGLTFRLAYHFPFWRIERTAERWNFDVARKSFDPESTDLAIARQFAARARRRLFGLDGDPPPPGDTVLIVLQGQLLSRRSFQDSSPMDMIRRTLTALPGAKVRISLHPSETYSPDEIEALRDTIAPHVNARVAERRAIELLPEARLVVTQNSAVALTGFFFHRPAVLFARSDFHHIAARDVDSALSDPPDFDRYLHWFLQDNAINAGAPDVRDQILRRLADHGWRI